MALPCGCGLGEGASARSSVGEVELGGEVDGVGAVVMMVGGGPGLKVADCAPLQTCITVSINTSTCINNIGPVGHNAQLAFDNDF